MHNIIDDTSTPVKLEQTIKKREMREMILGRAKVSRSKRYRTIVDDKFFVILFLLFIDVESWNFYHILAEVPDGN